MAEAFNLEQVFRAGLARQITIAGGQIETGTGTHFFSLLPGYNTVVTLNKNGSTATLQGTNDFTPGGDVDNALFSDLKLSESTTDYQQGHTAGLTGLKVDITGFVGNVEIIISQYKTK